MLRGYSQRLADMQLLPGASIDSSHTSAPAPSEAEATREMSIIAASARATDNAVDNKESCEEEP